MNFLIISISAVFLLIGIVLTEQNAKYLLAGYNTMSPEERKKVDIQGLITCYKKFFIFLGISFLFIGLTSIHYLSEHIVGLIICLYPIVMLIYLLVKSQKFYKKD